ncbi:MAG: hypothetical protein JWN54_2261 [Mycobacterium sp.]|jgi:uncharacterized protein (TIGR03083 family)|nr:hypothetical protein [Mycobacterium sp.]
MSQLTPDRYYGGIAQATSEFADLIPDTDPARPVPTCPEWTFADLVAHLGRGHRWIAAMVERRTPQQLPVEAVDDRTPPEDPAKQAGWIRDGAMLAVRALQEAGPDAPMWTFTPDRRAGFWLRRLAHETSAHGVDAALTAGKRVSLPADLSADGVSEVLDLLTYLVGSGRGELRGNGESLHFHSTDGWLGRDGEWFVRRTPDGIEWEHGHGKADVAVRGNAADLFLLLSRRAPRDSGAVEVLGERAVLDHWLDNSAF